METAELSGTPSPGDDPSVSRSWWSWRGLRTTAPSLTIPSRTTTAAGRSAISKAVRVFALEVDDDRRLGPGPLRQASPSPRRDGAPGEPRRPSARSNSVRRSGSPSATSLHVAQSVLSRTRTPSRESPFPDQTARAGSGRGLPASLPTLTGTGRSSKSSSRLIWDSCRTTSRRTSPWKITSAARATMLVTSSAVIGRIPRSLSRDRFRAPSADGRFRPALPGKKPPRTEHRGGPEHYGERQLAECERVVRSLQQGPVRDRCSGEQQGGHEAVLSQLTLASAEAVAPDMELVPGRPQRDRGEAEEEGQCRQGNGVHPDTCRQQHGPAPSRRR